MDCIGKILAALGNETNDPKITAFAATVQAYGLLHSEPYTGSNTDKITYKRQIVPLAKQYLRQAIDLEPTWKFPKKLLKEIAGCATEKVISIKGGITTKKYVESNFGKPSRIEKVSDKENWYYDNFETGYNPNLPFNYPKEMQTYYVQFDKRGRVVEDRIIVQLKE